MRYFVPLMLLPCVAGWALGDSVAQRLVPIAMGAGTTEYTLAFIVQACKSNIQLVG